MKEYIESLKIKRTNIFPFYPASKFIFQSEYTLWECETNVEEDNNEKNIK